jgi:hypothetical protein
MKVEINVPDYSKQNGLQMEWEDGSAISVEIANASILIEANRAGLVSLARLLLTLAGERVPAGHHWHLDDSNSLEDGSSDLIIEKM